MLDPGRRSGVGIAAVHSLFLLSNVSRSIDPPSLSTRTFSDEEHRWSLAFELPKSFSGGSQNVSLTQGAREGFGWFPKL